MFLLTIVLLICNAHSATVYVGSPGLSPCSKEEVPCHPLDYYAQHTNSEWKSGTLVIFQPGKHLLSVNLALTVNNVTNLTLKAANCYELESVVKCSEDSGFVFRGVNNLLVECLTFSSCGRYSEPKKGCGPLFVALLISNSKNITIKTVTIEHSKGYGVCAQDIDSFQISNSVFQYNAGNVSQYGGNIQVFYNQSINTSFNVSETKLLNGCSPKGSSFSSGLTIKLSSIKATLNILIHNVVFKNNTSSHQGGSGGHISLVMHSLNNFINITNTHFITGSAEIGGAIYISISLKPPLTLGDHKKLIDVFNCTFENNSAVAQGGAVYLIYHEYAVSNFTNDIQEEAICMTQCNFSYNSVITPKSPFGTALQIKSIPNTAPELRPIPQIKVVISECNFYNNSHHIKSHVSANSYTCGQIYLTGMSHSLINETRINSSDCSGVLSDQSKIVFSGFVVISNNTAVRGAGMYLSHQSEFYLTPYTYIEIRDNIAYYGGGLYVEQSSQCFLEETVCIYQLDKAIQQDKSLLDSVNVTFTNNTAAVSGHDWFGGSIESCYILSSFGSNPHHKGSHYFYKVFSFTTKKTSYISSTPYGVCFCDNNLYDCSNQSHHISVHPGQNVLISVILVGQCNGPVPGIVRIKGDSNVTLDTLQYVQKLQRSECTNIFLTLYSNESTAKLNLSADAWCKNKQLFQKSVNVIFKKCPVGFKLSPHSYCSCIGQPYFSCNLDSGKIFKNSTQMHWIGYDNASSEIVIGLCPYDYCKDKDVTIDTTSDNLNYNVQCRYGRNDILCGECSENMSVIFGGSECWKCDNKYILLFAVFAAGGVLLILIITVLDITVSHGTINGLIFYVNIIHVLETWVLPASVDRIPILFHFVSWLNFNLGIKTCFYNGMDAYSKIWLQWVFPLYVFILIAIIVSLARHYTWIMRLVGRNSTNVLATLLLLSLSKIILNVVSVFTFTNLKYHPSETHWKTVWSFDGNIMYGSINHILMMVLGVAAILFTLPYIGLLLSVQFVRRVNHRCCNWISHFKPLTDAYIGIYKDKYAFWTGHLLLVRAVICLVATFGFIQNPMIILGIVIGSCIHILILSMCIFRGVYRHWLLDVLEASFILNTCFLCVTTAFIMKGNISIHQKWATYTSITAAFVTFIGIVSYHVHLRLLCITKYKNLQDYIWNKIHPSKAEMQALL